MPLLIASSLVVSLLAACGTGGGSGSGGQSAFYQGKTLKIIVPFSAGGSTDLIARTVAQNIGTHLTGKPKVIVENIDGGGGIVGSNQFYASKADGLTMAVIGQSQKLAYVLGLDQVKFDVTKMPFIGAFPLSFVCLAAKSTNITSDNIQNPPTKIIAGGVSPSDVSALTASIPTRELFKLPSDKFKLVTGFPGGSDLLAAFKRGEVNYACADSTNFSNNYKPLVDQGKAVPVFQFGELEGTTIMRSKAMPDIPTIQEVYKKATSQDPTGVAWQAIQGLIGLFTITSGWFLPPDTSDERVAEVRKAFQEMSTDSKWVELATKVFGYKPDQLVVGDEGVKTEQAALANFDPTARDWLKSFISSNGG
jgi:tripartite-type tricarboxylate transporter receptor subunit TctC